ncbi:hypothetical protein HYH02_001552 [Chlamydomonas schloesseri]|uniref:Uncharacterized protein n=1 Tax=Chlamydomonas schloesseri TaxID=2026947 RepID=A0A835WSE7_9CHLO|nr:hypothetical protein HYH02_001552 [Chlamydomonas schloesseri]|eukprot:KAG2453328.1 hypothetical protein HYH02_001552 [Chlamydomonas schloesseri]
MAQKLPPAVSIAWGSTNAAGLTLPSLIEACSSQTLEADPTNLSWKATTTRASLAPRRSVRFALDGDDLHSAVTAARANAPHLTEPGGYGGPALKPMLTASVYARGLAYRASDGGALCYSGGVDNTSGGFHGNSGHKDGALGRATCHNGAQAPRGSSYGGCSSSGRSSRGPERAKAVSGADGGSNECEEGGDVEISDLVHAWSDGPHGGGGAGGHASRRGHQSRGSRSRSRSRGGSLGGAVTSAGSSALPSNGASSRPFPAALASGWSITSITGCAAPMSGAFTPGSLAASAAASLRRPSSVKLEATQRTRAAVRWAMEAGTEEGEDEEEEEEEEEEEDGENYGSAVKNSAARVVFATCPAAAIPAHLAPPAALAEARCNSGSVSSRSGVGRGFVGSPKRHPSSPEARGGWRGYWRRGWSHFVAALSGGRTANAKSGNSRQQQQQQQQQAAEGSERPGVPASGLSVMSVSSRSPSMMAFRLRAADSRTVNLRRMSKAKRQRTRPPIFAIGAGAAGQPLAVPPPAPAVSRFAADAAGAATVRMQPSHPPPQHVAGPHAPRTSAPGRMYGIATSLGSSDGNATSAWVVAGGALTSTPGVQGAVAPESGRQSFYRSSSFPARGFKLSSSSVWPEPTAAAPAPLTAAGTQSSLGPHYPHHNPEVIPPGAEPALNRTTPRVKKMLSFNPTVENDRGTTEALRGMTPEGKRPTPTGAVSAIPAQPGATLSLRKTQSMGPWSSSAPAPAAKAGSNKRAGWLQFLVPTPTGEVSATPAQPGATPSHNTQSMGPWNGSAPAPAAKAGSSKRVGWLQKLVHVFSSRQDPLPPPKGSAMGIPAAATADPFLASTGTARTTASGDSGDTWGSDSSSGGGASAEHAVRPSDPSICSSDSSDCSHARAAARKLQVLDSRVVHYRRLQQQKQQQHQAPAPQQLRLRRLRGSVAPQPQPQPPQQQHAHHESVHHEEEEHARYGESDTEDQDEEKEADTGARAALRKRLLEHAASVRDAPGDEGGAGPVYFVANTAASRN